MTSSEHSPAAAGFAVAASLTLGAGAAVALSRAEDDGLKFLIALAVIVLGLGVAAPASDPHHLRTRVLGRPVLLGIAVGAAVLGAYLGGIALVGAATEDPTFLEAPDLPSPTLIILLTYGLPALALLAFAANGVRAGLVGVGLIVPTMAVLLLVEWDVRAAPLALVMLALALVCLAVVYLSPGRSWWSDLAAVVGGIAAASAAGAGTSPLGSLSAPSAPTASETPGLMHGVLSPGVQGVVLACVLAVTAALVILALLRRDAAGGVVAALVLVAPPAPLLERFYSFPPHGVTPGRIALVAVPLAVAGLALAALRAPAVRSTLTRTLRRGVPPSALLAAAAIAAIVLVVQALQVMSWDQRLQGVIALVALAAGATAAWRLPGTSGAIAAGATLVGLALASPWRQLINGDPGVGDRLDTHIASIAIVGLLAAGAATWALARRHRHPGVIAAAAYLLAQSVAVLLYALLHPDIPSELSERTVMAVLVGPLVLLGVPAAVAALRGRGAAIAAGQAVGAVLLMAGMFALVRVVLSAIVRAAGADIDFVAQAAFAPLTPTDAVGISSLIREPGNSLVLWSGLLMLLALILLISVARRPSAPLAAAAGLAAIDGAYTALIGAVQASGVAGVNRLMWGLLVGGAVLGVIAATYISAAQAASIQRARRAAP